MTRTATLGRLAGDDSSRVGRVRHAIWWSLPAVLVLSLPGFTPSFAAAPGLTIEPAFLHLGSFSTLDPLDNEIAAGRTRIEVQSTESWQLELQIEGPVRRTSDGVELPLSRLAEKYPAFPPEVINFQPWVERAGPGSEEPQVFDTNWLDLASWLEICLDPADPPGTYEVTILGRLLDGSGNPLADHISTTLQFEVQPWVDLVDAALPDFEVQLSNGALEAESIPLQVTVISNTGWRLSVAAEGNLSAGEGRPVFEPSTLSACLPGGGAASTWRPLATDAGCVPLQAIPVAIAAGAVPPPFTLTTAGVPVVIRFSSEPPVPVGRYETILRFTAQIDASPP